MNKFNIAELSIKNKSILIYFIICTIIGGIICYNKLGRMENPDFTIRQMIVSIAWPGASAEQMQYLVLDNLERKLQETPELDSLTSYARPEEAIIYIKIKGTYPKEKVRNIWLEARNIANDAKKDLPEGVLGPFFNDRFGDTFCSVYAIIGDDYSYEEKRKYAEKIRRNLLTIETIKRVDLIGAQNEKIYIDFDAEKIAALGITIQNVFDSLSSLASTVPAGIFETANNNIYFRIPETPHKTKDIENTPITINRKTIYLKDIAVIKRGYSEPAQPKMFFNGKEAIGIAVSMAEGGNIIALGKQLDDTIKKISSEIPIGLEIHTAAAQPEIVKNSINEFFRSMAEAVGILLIVCFLSLGIRTGLVISICIPLVFAGVFIVMYILGIDMNIVSLGSLIIALGLLVDDEIIAAEMISVKLAEGKTPYEAAASAYKITAKPMLSGTLITCSGFIPIGFAKGEIAEFTSSIFPVLTAALIISWIISITAAPALGHKIIKAKKNKNPYEGKFYTIFYKFLEICLKNKKKVIIFSIILFAGSLYSMKFLNEEFFPSSRREELIVKITASEGASIKASEKIAASFADFLNKRSDVSYYSYYTGEGAPRFVTTFNPSLPSSNISEFIIKAKNIEKRDLLKDDIEKLFNTHYTDAVANIKILNMGPDAPYPVMLRITGENTEKVREIAEKAADILSQDKNLKNINFDWREQGKAVIFKTDNIRLSEINSDRTSLANYVHSMVSGVKSSEYYEKDRIIDVIIRLDKNNLDISGIKNLPVLLKNGRSTSLSHLADVEYTSENVSIWRKNLMPALTLSADIIKGTPNDMTAKAYKDTEDLRKSLETGYTIEIAGSLEESEKSLKYLAAPIPVMIIIILTILIFQLKKFSLVLIAVLTAPFGITGVFAAMFFSCRPLGFIAYIGIIALAGMIIRNSIILIDQTEKNIKEGFTPYNAVIKASVFRFRPIMLTAATAILAMIPLMFNNFWSPIAFAISGGLFFGTLLTLIILPCIYAAWFGIEK